MCGQVLFLCLTFKLLLSVLSSKKTKREHFRFQSTFHPRENFTQQTSNKISPDSATATLTQLMTLSRDRTSIISRVSRPLTILSTGLYGHDLLNQNGAPLRLVVPWKYGFKSIKSISTIRFVKEEPKATWSMIAPNEYGFYSNVNNTVHHPRWSQGTERRIGEFKRRPTLMFNGYEEEVAHLYKDMDLNKYF